MKYHIMQVVKEKIQEYPLFFGGCLLFLIVGGIMWNFTNKPMPQAELIEIEESSLDELSSSEETWIYVDIKGEVNNPGVYQMDEECRLLDLIDKAGGFTNEADNQKVNLAQKLTDQAMIVIPSVEEDSVSSELVESMILQTPENQTGKININTAGIEELTTLSGIGEKKAQQIIEYREKNGSFKKVDDLENVSGIGKKTVEKLKAEVCI